MSSRSILRGSMWLYIGGATANIIGYFYWILASRLVVPAVVGSASAILAMNDLLITVFSFGLTTGVRRFIGESHGKENQQDLFQHFFTNLALLAIPNLSVSFLFLLSPVFGVSVFGLSAYQLSLVGVISLVSFWIPAFISFFSSILRTEVTAIAQIGSAVVKITFGLIILVIWSNLIGIVTAILTAFVISIVIFLYWTRKLYRDSLVKVKIESSLWRSHIEAGLPAWIPNILTVAGQSVGFLIIFGLVGEQETGLYFMAFAIASLVYSIPASIQSLMFPVMSGMDDGRKRLTAKITQLAVAITSPIAIGLAIYSQLPFTLLGSDYLLAAPLLSILVLGAAIYPIYAGFYSYIYAIGRYREVTLMGIVLNGGRIVLYVLLVYSMSTIGIALSYVAAIGVALVGVFLVSKAMDFKMSWGVFGKTLLIPSIIASILLFFNIGWIIGLPLLLFVSALAYTRLNIISRSDVKEILLAILSRERLAKLYSHLRPLHWLFFGE